MEINILNVKKIHILKFQLACVQFICPLWIFLDMFLGVIFLPRIFMNILCCNRPYLKKNSERFKSLL